MIDLPKPIFNRGGCNLSFAGLKTAILRVAKTIQTEQDKFDLAASFQKTIEEILKKKTKIAFQEFKKRNHKKYKGGLNQISKMTGEKGLMGKDGKMNIGKAMEHYRKINGTL